MLEKHDVAVPTLEGWARHVGDSACKALLAAVDTRGVLERSLKHALTLHHANVTARRELAAREGPPAAPLPNGAAEGAAAAAAAP